MEKRLSDAYNEYALDPAKVEIGHVDVTPWHDEIEAATSNFAIGTSLLFENEQVRVWDISLPPGEGLAFHCHRTTYYFVTITPGRSLTILPNGETWTWEHPEGEVQFIPIGSDECVIHNLKNVGNTNLRFSTVELLST